MKRIDVTSFAARFVISVVGFLAGYAKFPDGYQSDYWTPEPVYYTLAIIESVASVSIWFVMLSLLGMASVLLVTRQTRTPTR